VGTRVYLGKSYLTPNTDKQLWLNYLIAINLQLFKECIGFARKGEIRPEDQLPALIGQIPPCWDELSNVYATGRPHIVRGNHMRYKSGLMELVDYLFDFGDNKPRGAWKKTSYCFMY
jgi:hypothetical protein